MSLGSCVAEKADPARRLPRLGERDEGGAELANAEADDRWILDGEVRGTDGMHFDRNDAVLWRRLCNCGKRRPENLAIPGVRVLRSRRDVDAMIRADG